MPSPAFVDAAFVAILLTVVLLVVLAFARAGGIFEGRRSGFWAGGGALVVVSAIALLDALAARSGWTTRWHDLPPRIPALALGAMLLSASLLRFSRARGLSTALSAASLIGFQAFRLPLELVLWALAKQDRLPPQMTFEGRNFDILVGITAPFVAWALSRKRVGWRTVVAWNLASLLLLINVTAVAIRSAPGPLHGFVDAPPLTLVATLPYVWLPGMLVPFAYLGHVLSLRWAFAERARSCAESPAVLSPPTHDDVTARSPAP